MDASNDTSIPVDDIPNVESTDAADTSTTAPKTAHTVEELSQLLASATQKAENHWENLLRKHAEYDNLQKRMNRDLENARKYALEKFSTELLAVKDSMELGLDAAAKPETDLKAIQDGITLTLKMLSDAMAKFGVVEINPLDQKFNPQWHEAMAMQTLHEVEDGTVLHVHQKGYQLNDRLLRPARVVVAKGIPVEEPLENQG
ncbi:MAG: nucleotide exchange factor GrpE [Gammaproteobacteria bacterium]|nr:MAG: nucleotide exchange factor GrpE [Gammaproteobacteria bacterium]RKZ43874.1 MAG: nucleotide exchange factor GrpE [Gammaproteobacteria bacterium]RKZ77138.1 MAG: nucleotide exchange factor GrpE [Gammaproteobacteria bacterium]